MTYDVLVLDGAIGLFQWNGPVVFWHDQVKASGQRMLVLVFAFVLCCDMAQLSKIKIMNAWLPGWPCMQDGPMTNVCKIFCYYSCCSRPQAPNFLVMEPHRKITLDVPVQRIHTHHLLSGTNG